MSEESTQNLNGGRSFEERVFARFDAMEGRFDAIDGRFDAVDARFDAVDRRFDAVDRRFDGVDARFGAVDRRFDGVDAAIGDLNSRVERLEVRSYDTKPIWEQALKEIVDVKRELSKRLDRIHALVLENSADLRDVDERVEKLESKVE